MLTYTAHDRTAVIGADATTPDAITSPVAALAVWQRALPAALRKALDASELDTVDDVAGRVAIDDDLDAILRDAGTEWHRADTPAAHDGLPCRRPLRSAAS